MRTARVLITFVDAEEGVYRDVGDAFQVADERGEQLEKKGFVALDPAEPKTRKKSTTKK